MMATSCTQPPYPSVELSNGLLTARVYLPDADHGYYRGPRFDWSGMVGPVEYAGHRFFGPFQPVRDPLANDDGIGPAEEFGIEQAPSYAETNANEQFIKIGVGVLIKPADPDYAVYHFYKPFAITDSPRWQVQSGPDWVECRQQLHGPRGWGYDYTKRLNLTKDEPVMIISHRLTNTGTKVIDTNWYCHNFVNVDGRPIGPDYRVRFPFTPIYKERPNPEDIRVEGNEFTFVRQFPPLYGTAAEPMNFQGIADARATIWNTQTGAGVDIRGDQPMVKYNVWTAPSAVCPEMFIHIHLAPGESQTWDTRYEFLARPNGSATTRPRI